MKIYWVIGILILVVFITACGTSTPAPSAAPPDQQAPTEPAAAPPTVPPAAPTAEQAAPTVIVLPTSATTIDGAALLQERCTVCHSLSRVMEKSESLEEWTMIVEEMMQKGAKLSEEEKLALIEYLSVTYPD